MFIIPGWLIALITFPGIIVHEISHRFFCDLVKIPVYNVCYFNFKQIISKEAGYVIHAPCNNLKSSFLISIGPLIINTFLCSLLTIPASITEYLNPNQINPVFLFLQWIGLSIGMHAFPSNQDMQNFLYQVSNSKKNILYLFAKFFSIIIALANALRFFWFDFVYAMLVSLLLPFIIYNI